MKAPIPPSPMDDELEAHKLMNLRELLGSLRTVCLRNLSCATTLERQPSSRGCLDLPLLSLQLAVFEGNDGNVSKAVEMFHGIESNASLNATWAVPETMWVCVPASIDPSTCTHLSVVIEAHWRTEGSEESTSALCSPVSQVIDVRTLLPISTSPQLPPLPLNSLVFEMASGMVYSTPQVCSVVSKMDAPSTPAGRRHGSFSLSYGQTSGALDAEELLALSKLRNEVLALEAKAAAVERELTPLLETALTSFGNEFTASRRVAAAECQRCMLAQRKEELASEESAAAQELKALEEEASEVAALADLLGDMEDEQSLLRSLSVDEEQQLETIMRLTSLHELRLAAGLQTVYPIRYREETGSYLIRALELPVDLYSRDDEMVSSSLGYTAHLVTMLAKYLCVALRYQVIYNGSRSTVRDGISGNGVLYPLFRRGVEHDRFDRAVELLGQDIQQLLASRGLQGGNSMLGNLQDLMAFCAQSATLI